MTLAGVVAVALGVAGAFFAVVAAVGLLRLPDVYSRAHAASKADTLGALLVLAAAGLAVGDARARIRITLLAGFVLVTGPAAAHAAAWAAHRSGIDPGTGPGGDES